MAKYKRLINCDFVNDSAFKVKLSNKAKLLYFFIFSNCDDYGFCGNVDELTIIFDGLEYQTSDNALISQKYADALLELVERGYLLKFDDKYNNSVYLVRHWYLHNSIPEKRVTPTNYQKYLDRVELNQNNTYCLIDDTQLSDKCQTDVSQVSDSEKRKKFDKKENKIKESKVNKSKGKEIKVKESNISDNNYADAYEDWTPPF